MRSQESIQRDLRLPADRVLKGDHDKTVPKGDLTNAPKMMEHSLYSYITFRLTALSRLHVTALYHFHQAVEKAMKACLIAWRQKSPPGHDLVQFAELCANYDEKFRDAEWRKIFERLTPFNESGRYPVDTLKAFGYEIPNRWLDAFIQYVLETLSRQGVEVPDVLGDIANRTGYWNRNEQPDDSDWERVLFGLQAALRLGNPYYPTTGSK